MSLDPVEKLNAKSNHSRTFRKRLYACTWENCNKKYNCKFGLQYHLRVHQKQQHIKCSLCDKSFRSQIYLKRHLVADHGQYRNTCDHCEASFKNKKGLNDHLLTHDIKPPKINKSSTCPWENCNKTFEQNNGLYYHLRTHNKEKPYKCVSCYQSFRSKRNLTRHSKLPHDSIVTDLTQNINECPWKSCKSVFKRPLILQEHIQAHQRDLATSKEKLRELKSNDTYNCPWINCYKKYKQSNGLLYHLRIHNNEKPFKCSSCDKGFRSSINLKTHYKSQHDQSVTEFNQNINECPWKNCTEVFKLPLGLQDHIQDHQRDLAASKEKLRELKSKDTYNCPWRNCNKKYNQSNGLLYHLRIHTNEKPFKCSSCDKRFRSSINLKTHYKSQHGQNLEESDNKKLIKLHKLKCHMRANKIDDPLWKPLSCTWPNCNRTYQQAQGLKYHMRSHQGNKSYKCSYCDKRFRTQSNLKLHVMNHLVYAQKKTKKISKNTTEIIAKDMENDYIDETIVKQDITEYIISEVDEVKPAEIPSPPITLYYNYFVEAADTEELILCD